MTGKHYQWHKRWVVVLAAQCAIHDSGAVVDFSYAGKAPAGGAPGNTGIEPQIVGTSILVDGSVWIASFRGGEAAVLAWLSSQKFDPLSQAAASRLRRIMREAGDAWAWQKNRETRNATPDT